ncbi:hypothetical protein OPS25_05390 [Alteromonas ponticola]|uniref:Lipoprotein n=1 Tax=Alteromonas aquimaris TaxID=2998417 RepID=A0ABT3P775_9ALTE|nr:hypothetical protein [Alteromonas aquimaris]MCW8107926.1 hypothetical protein [Alteromonas aquimaris]
MLSKSILLILTLIFLSACSTTIIHLISRYLNTTQQTDLVALLERHNFKVKLSEHPFPLSITDTTLVFSPLLTDPEALTTLHAILPIAGYPLSRSSALVEGKHWYTKNNIGFYPIPTGVDPFSDTLPAALAHEYKSENCAKNFSLTLSHSGRFRLVTDAGTRQKINGLWRVTEFPYLVLQGTNQFKNFYFEVKQAKLKDQVSHISVITLVPLNSHPLIPPCDVSFGERI